tara:strand:- start:2590 stop:3147 length:558 start_codon:yes stop_codon:yes gene_type:complete
MILKNIVLGIAIIILTVSVAVYGINIFYDAPEYADFCDEFKTAEVIDNQQRCEDVGGLWNEDGIPRAVVEGKSATGFCDRDYTCRMELEDAQEKYSKNIFLFALPLGIAVIAIGAFVFGLESVGAGLMGGGVGIILYGVAAFWRFADDWLKFILSLVGLIAVIWLAYLFNSNNWNIWKKNKKRKK